jgi:hypothetical protein
MHQGMEDERSNNALHLKEEKMAPVKNGGPLPTIKKLANKIKDVADSYPLGSQQIAEQEKAASEIIESAGEIQKQAELLREITNRYKNA